MLPRRGKGPSVEVTECAVKRNLQLSNIKDTKGERHAPDEQTNRRTNDERQLCELCGGVENDQRSAVRMWVVCTNAWTL